ncbi:hypothetical protein LTSESEN_4388 [Salmonella enterica subsp. enterica serovar Senftenberg str. A4-543]|uniref:Uncharacterized protein n=1 Tax=Salmonella enterica subsp. enterica serovar Senftenberg str. A4-543 TaxID=913082 RepID=G5R4A6_SALSE|nr:hypothetical protein LTSESEN_4388 [Salmonella enterica subsp. enterica serovar Senftenberg str. A4-543]
MLPDGADVSQLCYASTCRPDRAFTPPSCRPDRAFTPRHPAKISHAAPTPLRSSAALKSIENSHILYG